VASKGEATHWGRYALPLLLVAVLAACTRPTGDFGRAQPSVLHDELMPQIGAYRAARAGEPVSSFNLTDQEVELRDRVWRYLVAPHAYDWFSDSEVELQRTRLVPIKTTPKPVDTYYNWLHGTRFASSRVRFNRLAEDVRLDVALMRPTFQAICAVQEGDRQRRIARDGLAGLGPKTATEVEARRRENNAIIDWFVRSAENRHDSYSYALDHLLVETPHQEAIAANAEITTLALWIERAERGDFCSGDGGVQSTSANGPASRYLRSSDQPIYRK
jgi:hypothetical protein